MGANPAKAVARTAARSWGSLTSTARPLPELLVVGAKRGGTTSMFRAIQSHPQVLGLWPKLQDKKSPHYFDLEYHRGERWYRSHLPTERARRTPAGAPVRITGDASPYYLFHPHAAARIGRDLPDARLLVLLRDPVDRAFSHYWDRVKNGIEDLPFDEAIAREDERLEGELARMLADERYQSHAYEHFSYVRRGRYAEQLERLFGHVGRDRVLVLRSEDFYDAPQARYEEVLGFLGLEHHEPDEFARLHGHADKPVVPAAVRADLEVQFAPHNEALAQLLGTEVWW